MLDELRAFLADPGDEDDGWARFESVAFDDSEALLLLLVSPPAWPRTWSRFEIRTAAPAA